MKIGLAIIYYLILFLYLFYTYKKEFISLPFIFLAAQGVMFSGIALIADMTVQADRTLLYVYLTALISFILGVEFFKRTKTGAVKKPVYHRDASLLTYQKERIYIIVFISIIACIYLFRAIGSNIFINVATSFFLSGEAVNVTEARLASYGVSGIGYVYQFRVILLPVLTAYLVSFNPKKAVGYIVFPLMIIFLLGTGQRGGFVIFGVMWLLSLIYNNKFGNQNNMKKIIIVGIIIFVLFGVMTVANGRVTSDNNNVIGAILDRFVNDNQTTAVTAFRYISSQPTQWGQDWLYMLKDILPGKSDYLPVANRVFEILYGSTRGTAPPCIWGSTYYNWGPIGIVIFPFLLGVFYRYMNCRLFARVITPLRLIIYTFMFVSLGTWIADGPVGLFNQGFIALCILAWILHIDKSSERIERGVTNDIHSNSSVQRREIYRRNAGKYFKSEL